jgi:hypothetical protein
MHTEQLTQVADETSETNAILSHVWMKPNEKEVSFHDLRGGTLARLRFWRKRGYRKLLSACKLAASDGVDYLWMDTCCINSANDSERSEAIRPMYLWYSAAKVCYAYLPDACRQSEAATGAHEAVPAVPDSIWFKRG